MFFNCCFAFLPSCSSCTAAQLQALSINSFWLLLQDPSAFAALHACLPCAAHVASATVWCWAYPHMHAPNDATDNARLALCTSVLHLLVAPTGFGCNSTVRAAAVGKVQHHVLAWNVVFGLTKHIRQMWRFSSEPDVNKKINRMCADLKVHLWILWQHTHLLYHLA